MDLVPVEPPSTVTASPASPIDSTGVSLTSSTNASSLPFPPPATTTAPESGVAKVPQEKCLPPVPRDKSLPPTPLLAFGAEASASSPCPTPPVTPFAAPSAKTPADFQNRANVPSPRATSQEPRALFPVFRDATEEAATAALKKEQAELFSAFRDRTETPASVFVSKEQMDLHLAFRDNTKPETSSPPAGLPVLPQPGSLQPEQPHRPAFPELHGLLDEADSSKRLESFNPFGRPGSFVLSQTPPPAPREEPAPPPPGKVRQSS